MSEDAPDAERPVERIAREHYRRGDAVGWFDALYREADGDAAIVPWADLEPNPALVTWLDRVDPGAPRGRALVVGAGLGDDAEAVAAAGWDVDAFDVSPAAVAWATRRFPASPVRYREADLLDPPAGWAGAFDLVVEIYTLQALPAQLRGDALRRIAAFVAPGGTLLAVAFGRADDEDPGPTIPWPLSHAELAAFEQHGLREVRFEDDVGGEDPRRRFRIELRRPA